MISINYWQVREAGWKTPEVANKELVDSEVRQAAVELS